ncbi:MAG: branched-chain amino acid ABC transporter permease [Defluviitaleaceae bacterium]|nr:branched-chain amino acid ABC transporter permease [Defluviitaleaceae bacterium]MCL2273878.1 branched-chain amino acid ABC transporter permease [Defluviitaleaceae bacterium]
MNVLALYKKSRPYSSYVIFGVLLALAPLMVNLGVLRFFHLTLIAGVVIYAIVALGLNLLMGYAGLVSLGTAAFMGVGAYLTAFFTQDLGMDFLPSIVLTVVITSILGILVGLLSLRVEGFFLAMATLAVAEILRQVFIEFTGFTNSFVGRTANFPEFFGFTMNRNQTFILLVVFLVLAMFVTQSFANSYTGRALSAMRGSEAAASAMGINIFKYRLIAFSVSTAYAGLGGALYMHFIRFTFPNVWMFTLSLMLFAVVVIGGVRSVAGTVVGAFVVFGVPDLILVNIPVIGDINGMAFVFTGVLIIVVVMYYPAGLIYIWHDIKVLVHKVRGRGKV